METKKFKNDEEKRKILERIKKILALAKGTTFEGEADTAMKMAQSYMIQYGLSMTDVEIGEELEGQIVTSPLDRQNPEEWERILGLAVATVTDTQSYTKMLHKGSVLMFMGYKDDVDFAKVLFSVLRVGVNSSARKTFPDDRKMRDSFRLGCVVRLEERAKEEKQTVVQEPGNNRFALVVVEKKSRIAKWADENLNLKNKNANRGRSINPIGFAMGKAHANKMDLMNKAKVENNSALQIGHSK